MEPDFAVGVCGFGRCGSTMVMEMLNRGGLAPVEGSGEISYEFENIAGRARSIDAAGRAVKLLDVVLYSRLAKGNWRFIWIDRNLQEQAKSMIKFLTMLGEKVDPFGAPILVEGFRRDRPRALSALRARGSLLVLSYDHVLAEPEVAAVAMRAFLECPLDTEAMAAAVHARSPQCVRGMTFELTGAQA